MSEAAVHGRNPFESLPEHAIHHILSLLPGQKAAARTAAVSKSLRSACSSRPIFKFMFTDFRPMQPLYEPLSYEPEALREINDTFLQFVGATMSRIREHGIVIPRLTISTVLFEIDRSRVLFDELVGMALDDGAQVLQLMFSMEIRDLTYLVPARVFFSGSIRSIVFSGKGLSTPLDSISAVNLTSLRSLKLYCIRLDELMLHKLLRGCPLLERLKLYGCEPLAQIVIFGPNNLRKVSLSDPIKRVQIESQTLDDFHYWDSGLRPKEIEDLVFVMDRCPNVKHLKIISSRRRRSSSRISQQQFQGLLSKFLLLESFSVQHCGMIKKIRISNPLLKKIEIVDCQGLVDIEIESANLSCFQYIFREMSLPLVKLMNPAAITEREGSFTCHQYSIPNANWFVGLGKLLTGCFMFRSLSFNMSETLREGDVQSSDDSLPSLPCEIDRLDLLVGASKSNYAAILNKLLSVCHPKILRARPIYDGCDFLEFLCKKLENAGDNDVRCCGCSGPRKCWLHELKAVEIERITTGLGTYRGPLVWCTLFELLPTFRGNSHVCFRLYWK